MSKICLISSTERNNGTLRFYQSRLIKQKVKSVFTYNLLKLSLFKLLYPSNILIFKLIIINFNCINLAIN